MLEKETVKTLAYAAEHDPAAKKILEIYREYPGAFSQKFITDFLAVGEQIQQTKRDTARYIPEPPRPEDFAKPAPIVHRRPVTPKVNTCGECGDTASYACADMYRCPVCYASFKTLEVKPEPEVVRQAPASNADALEEHTASSGLNHELVEHASVVVPSSPNEPTHGLAVMPAATAPSASEDGPCDTDNFFDHHASVSDFIELQTAKIDEESACVGQHPAIVETAPNAVSVSRVVENNQPERIRNRRRNPWSGYKRPERPNVSSPKAARPERDYPVPPRARDSRVKHRRTDSVPEYVRNEKINLEQHRRCVFCYRHFDLPILHNGEVEILKPHPEHFKPRAAGGRTSGSNIAFACHPCNLCKSDFLFDTIEEVQDFLALEWAYRGYTDCPTLIPFKKLAAHAGTYN